MSDFERDYTIYLDDIFSAIEKIETYTHSETLETFTANSMAIDAVIRNFEIIGEAATHIPLTIRQKHSSVEWREMIGFRNVLIHGYFGINISTVWNTVQNNVPVLKKHIAAMMQSLEYDTNNKN